MANSDFLKNLKMSYEKDKENLASSSNNDISNDSENIDENSIIVSDERVEPVEPVEVDIDVINEANEISVEVNETKFIHTDNKVKTESKGEFKRPLLHAETLARLDLIFDGLDVADLSLNKKLEVLIDFVSSQKVQDERLVDVYKALENRYEQISLINSFRQGLNEANKRYHELAWKVEASFLFSASRFGYEHSEQSLSREIDKLDDYTHLLDYAKKAVERREQRFGRAVYKGRFDSKI